MGTIVTSNGRFGLPEELIVTITDTASFYSLYADGLFSRKTYFKESGTTCLAYTPGTAVFLYYTYPTHRAASLIRVERGKAELPGLSKKVTVLFTVHASKVDKLKRAVGFLNKHTAGAYGFSNDFYIRLYFILQCRGKLNYGALRVLTEKNHV